MSTDDQSIEVERTTPASEKRSVVEIPQAVEAKDQRAVKAVIDEVEVTTSPQEALEIIAEVPQKKDGFESIAEANNQKTQERRQGIVELDLARLGFSEEEIMMADSFTDELEKRICDADDNPDIFLESLEEEGITVVNDSKYLGAREYANHDENAAFMTARAVLGQLDKWKDHGDSPAKRELEGVVNEKGTIFLKKSSTPKSKFHEGGHAVQMLAGMEMDEDNKEKRLKAELIISRALIKLKQRGLLHDVEDQGTTVVTKEDGRKSIKREGKNDIYQEVLAFERWEKQLEV